MTKTSGGPELAARASLCLTVTVVSVVAIAVLYWAQSIFIPVALGAFLTFLLSPLVSALRQRGVGRTPAVLMTVLRGGARPGDGGLGGHDPDFEPARANYPNTARTSRKRPSHSRRSRRARAGSRR